MAVEFRVRNTLFRVTQGDITALQLQHGSAIVNAANSALLGGGGVDGAIHRAGGPDILAECRAIGGCKTGDAVTTTSGQLEANGIGYVIHTVGPVWEGGGSDEPEKLRSCYRRSLQEAKRVGARTIAFPAISTGVYRFPLEQATSIAVDEFRAFALDNGDALDEILFVTFSSRDTEVYERELARLKDKMAE